jgi:hypothetical protein
VLRGVSLVPGSDFEIVVVSIDPKETERSAAAKASCVAGRARERLALPRRAEDSIADCGRRGLPIRARSRAGFSC